MVTHVVIFNWVAGTTPQQVERLAAAFDRLAAEVADLGALRHGPDLGFRDGGGDYGLVATFADKAAWDAYQADPRHKAFVRDEISPLQASRLTLQFQPSETSQ